jgi:GNAT superfamily N-acetyltransferase
MSIHPVLYFHQYEHLQILSGAFFMIAFRELQPDLWPALETLFGAKGACGGCWCQTWRVERGGKLWEETKGEPARLRMKELVQSGKANGILAFDGDDPVGWCSFGPRADFPRIETMKAYRHDDNDGAWSITCLFLSKENRGKGIARGLIREAIEAMRKRNVRVIEGYPVPLTKDGKKLPAAFSWTGPQRVFEDAGFRLVQQLSASRPLVQLVLED